jgi:hypothetical protein
LIDGACEDDHLEQRRWIVATATPSRERNEKERGRMKRTVIASSLIALAAIAGLAPDASAVVCGETIVADTTLDASLTCPNGDGLLIGASNITLDLDKHSITGDKKNDTAGIRILNGLSGISIVNGSIRNFERGIDGTNAQVLDSEFCDLKISGNTEDGIKIDGSGNTVCDNKTDKNGRHGINVVGGDNDITGNNASSNGQVQIKLQGTGFLADNNMKTKSNAFKPVDAPSGTDGGDNKCKIPKDGKPGDIGGSPCPEPKI